jgi:hypothetical protein
VRSYRAPILMDLFVLSNFIMSLSSHTTLDEHRHRIHTSHCPQVVTTLVLIPMADRRFILQAVASAWNCAQVSLPFL